MTGQSWRVYGVPCALDWWPEPHAHLLRDDDTPGVVVERVVEIVARHLAAGRTS